MARIVLEKVGVNFQLFYAGNRSLKRSMLGSVQATPSSRNLLKALADVSLVAEPGTRLAVLGNNASGKTTLLRVMAGLLQPTAGRAERRGCVVSALAAGTGIGPAFTVADTIIGHGLLMGFPLSDCRARLPCALRFGDLEEIAQAPLNTLSHGEQARVALSLAPAYDADILLIDEITEHLSPSFVEHLFDYVRSGMPPDSIFIMVERSRSLLERICDRAILLRDGAIADAGPLADMLARHGQHTIY